MKKLFVLLLVSLALEVIVLVVLTLCVCFLYWDTGILSIVGTTIFWEILRAGYVAAVIVVAFIYWAQGIIEMFSGEEQNGKEPKTK